MAKNKKSKRKRREEDESVNDESPFDHDSEDGVYGSNAREVWNTDDLYFDRNGRLVVKNAALAEAIARAVSEQGGIVVHMTYPEGSIVGDPPPKEKTPPWQNQSCPDQICGRDLNLVVKNKPMRDPPRDRSWEQRSDRPL
jgi:hypothetical protein